MDKHYFRITVYLFVIGLVNAHFLDSAPEVYTNVTVRWKRQNRLKCTLPDHPDNGHWIIINGDGEPGDEIDVNTILRLECRDGYRLNPILPIIPCDNNWNPNNFPTCEKKCPAFYSTPTTSLQCIDKEGVKVPCDQAIDGAYLTFSCIAYYEVPIGNKRSLFCRQGIWDFPKPICQPVCGKKVNNETLVLSYGGVEVKDLEYPWVVALYRKDEKYINICGGTLVSRRVVLTAAHCVTNDYGATLPKENFEVAAGKYFNAHNDSRDQWAQYRKIAKLIVNEGYRGESQRFAADIAVIVTQKLFRLGPVVQPICINNIESIYLRNQQIGEIAGWGITEQQKVADRLRVIKIPFKDKSTCSRELPPSWEEKYNFFDKICAGYFRRNISVCQGDSGSGLIFKNPEDGRYYIHGIVSIAPNLFNAQCNYETNALYTSVAFYFSFIDREMQKNYVEDCILPPHPLNGKWDLENDAEKKPGDVIPSTSMLKFSCNKGFKLSSNSYYDCEDTFNSPIPTCNLLCSRLDFTKNTVVNCRNRLEEPIDCGDSTDGSSITYTCPIGFETEKGAVTSTRYCISGTYGTPRPDCVPALLVNKPKPLKPQQKKTANGEMKVICTYASWWYYKGVTPEDLDPTLCTHVVYNFIGISDTGDLRVQDEPLDLDQVQKGLFNRVIEMKKKNDKLKIILSVGGTAATNGTLFSRISRSPAKTTKFLGSAAHYIKTYHFDGLDIDWQHPEESDKEYYINFLQTIKHEFDKNGWLLSASVRFWFEETGYNISAMDGILDWVSIKSYDFYGGAWSKYTGIHNALYASSKEFDWEKDHYNLESVANNWMNAGLSKEKLILSVAFYGRSFTLKDKTRHGIHSPITGPGPGIDEGFIRYYELCSQYNVNFIEEWDEATQTVYKYDDLYWFGYNTKDAVWIKGEFIKKNGFGGVNVYPWDGDDNKGVCGMKHILLKHLLGGMGRLSALEN